MGAKYERPGYHENFWIKFYEKNLETVVLAQANTQAKCHATASDTRDCFLSMFYTLKSSKSVEKATESRISSLYKVELKQVFERSNRLRVPRYILNLEEKTF